MTQRQIFKDQNQHIKDSLSAVQVAVNVLIAKGMTVTGISVEGPYPRVDILPHRECEGLAQAWVHIKSKGGARIAERVALVNQCQVRWLDRDYH